ncbi:MAG: SDR family oxidoreductase [Planctomycetota bacterium]|nr:SDR family oxidoreductase [Planctomycetota bacterium]
MNLTNTSALVTGASSGIGRSIALALAQAGADVLVHCRQSVEEGQKVVDCIRSYGQKSAILTGDLRNPETCQLLLEQAWDLTDGINVWVNNAGSDILTGSGAALPFEEKLNTLIEVDLIATMLLSRAVGQRMKQHQGGVILNMGWDQAETGFEGDSGQLFSASKAAVMAFSRSLALTLAPEVRVNCLAPGWIKTQWGEQASEAWQERAQSEAPLKRWGKPDDVAAAAVFLCSSKASFMTGQIVRVNGGAVR